MHQHMSRYNAVQPSPKPSVRPALQEMHAASSHVPRPASRVPHPRRQPSGAGSNSYRVSDHQPMAL